MSVDPLRDDVEGILGHRHDNGADFWATSDRRIYKGNPFSTISSLGLLHALGVGPDHEAAQGGLELFLDVSRGRTHPGGAAVESLLDHWDVRSPIGPCHHGIGSAFMKAEYPVFRALGDDRFGRALAELESKLDEDGRMVVEHRHRGLKELAMCARGEPSDRATARYAEISANVGRA